MRTHPVRSVAPRYSLCVLAVLLLLAGTASAQVGAPEPDVSAARSLVHILDYLAKDYAAAVSGGEIIDALEYREMVEFSASAAALLEDLDVGEDLIESTRLLQADIASREAPELVASRAQAIRTGVIAVSGMQTSPLRWPSIADGEKSYQLLCSSCHGPAGAGDGPQASGLNPPPSRFTDGDRAISLSPFQAYNTIRMGVEGTAMAPFRQLSEKEMWDLAFFVKSLRTAYREVEISSPGDSAPPVQPALEQVATLNDEELLNILITGGVELPDRALAAIRLRKPDSSPVGPLGIARRYLDQALDAYDPEHPGEARQKALLAYLEGVEPIEMSLSSRDGAATITLEEQMLGVRSAIESGSSREDVALAVERAHQAITQAERILEDGQAGSPWFSFILAASILLREGLEAFLVIISILGVLRAAQQGRAALWVHGGWILALAIGVVAWVFSWMLLSLGAAQREIMEGGIALVAVVVLIYMGFWLHSKSEIHKWRAFIDQRVHQNLGTGNLLGLAAISFFAVFREAFESVLFLSALTVEHSQTNTLAVAGGAASSIVFVIALGAVVLRYSVRLPIRTLFRYSSYVMGVLCVILMGKGVHAFQEAGLLSVTGVSRGLRLDLLGIYPTVETLAAQIGLVIVALLLWALFVRKAPLAG
jgi:high-affinity iron transporter